MWRSIFYSAAIGVRKTNGIRIIIGLEVQLTGAELDQHGYLVDIVDIEANLEALVAYYRDKTLNDLPEFAGLNPSIEHFARIFCQALAERIRAPNVSAVTVQMWENKIAWARLSVIGCWLAVVRVANTFFDHV